MTTHSHRPASNISLQDRDLALIRMLAEQFRILSREQIGELFPMGSASRLNFRLKQLRDAGYLSCRTLSRMGKAAPYAYYLGPSAVDVFDDASDRRAVETMRSQVSQLSNVGLAHRMLVDSIHIRFLTSGRDYPHYKLVTWIDQYSSWWESVRAHGVPIQADGYAEYLMMMYFDSLFTFFLEVDRGTERGETIRGKFDRYAEFAASGVYEKQFAAPPFRVLIITTSERRARSLTALLRSRTESLFWITTWDLFKRSKLFERYWSRPGLEGLHSLTDHA